MGQISQMKLARETGIGRECIANYVNAEYPEKSMKIEILKKLAEFFHKDKYYFCNDYHIFLDTVDVRAFLQKKREKAKMSQRKFADKIGVSLQNYKYYERGNGYLPFEVWQKVK